MMRFVPVCIFITLLLTMTGCDVGGEQFEYTNEMDESRTLIVLSAPSVNNPYYEDVHQQIIDFQVAYANVIMGNDNVIVIADKDTMPLLEGRIPDDVLLEESIQDIWMRDFTTVIPQGPIRFQYRPSYYDNVEDAIFIQGSFEEFAERWGLQYRSVDLILDGGNIVDNDSMAITTERFLEDNDLFASDAWEELRAALGVEYVAVIPYDDDVMGHADGMVMIADDDTVLVNEYQEPFRTMVLDALRDGLPASVEIIEVKAEFDDSVWDVYASACGINLNATVTNDHIYVPVFASQHDERAIEIISAHTDKLVHRVNARGVCFMGGSVRCLSWQVEGENARKLIEAARSD